MTQPLDVLKTRAMNAKPGEFKVRKSWINYLSLSFHHLLLNSFCSYHTLFVEPAAFVQTYCTAGTFSFLQRIRTCFCTTCPSNDSNFCFSRTISSKLWLHFEMNFDRAWAENYYELFSCDSQFIRFFVLYQ